MLDGIGARIATLVDGDEVAVRARRLASFEQAFVLVVAAEYWLRAIPKWGQLGRALRRAARGRDGRLRRGRRRTRAAAPRSSALAAIHAFVLLWSEFPASGNHAYLELYVCLLAALLRPDDAAEGTLDLRARAGSR